MSDRDAGVLKGKSYEQVTSGVTSRRECQCRAGPQGESRQGDRNEKEICWNVPEIDNRLLVLLLGPSESLLKPRT